MKRWNIDYLKQLHTKYSKLALCDDPTLSLEYESTANCILDIIDRYDQRVNKKIRLTGAVEVKSYKSIISDDFGLTSRFGYYCPYIRQLAQYEDLLEMYPNEDISKIEFNASQIIKVSDQFYKQFKGQISSLYGGIRKTFNDTVHFRKLTSNVKEAGQTYSVYGTDISFFEIGYCGNLQDYVSSIHEFAHGIACKTKPERIWNTENYCFIELESLFFELLGTEYIGNVLKKQKDAFDISMQIFRDYVYSAQLLTIKLDMYSIHDRLNLNDKRFTKKYLSNDVGLNKIGIKDVMNTYMRDNMHYIISYLTAIELYLIYKNNPDMALDLLFKVIEYDTCNNKEYLDYVKSLGIEPGKNIDVYIEMLMLKAKEFNDEKSLRYKN